jgi:hypothetical protein
VKILLAILCGLMLLFGGGCAIAVLSFFGNDSGGTGILAVIPFAVFVFNLLVLIALFGWSHPWRPAFYILAVVDFIIAVGTLISFAATAVSDPSVLPWALLMAGGFGLKGWLTWQYVRGLQQAPGPAS